jgi:hypothetical protein
MAEGSDIIYLFCSTFFLSTETAEFHSDETLFSYIKKDGGVYRHLSLVFLRPYFSSIHA